MLVHSLDGPLTPSLLHQEPYHFYGGFTKYWYSKFVPDNGFKLIEIVPNGSLYTTIVALYFTLIKQSLEDLLYSKKVFTLYSLFMLLLFIPVALILTGPLFLAEKLFKRYEFTAGYHVRAIKI
jgi:hypothetical protein